MAYVPKHLKLWQLPASYAGAQWPEYYVVMGQHRDSDRVTRSNWQVAKRKLDAIAAKYPEWINPTDGDTAMLVDPHEGHWAVGWVEWLGVHTDAPEELLQAADEIAGRIAEYPILDEDHYSNLEWQEATEYWDSLPVHARLSDYVTPAKLPCFAARHDLSTIMHEYRADWLWESLTSD